MNRFVFLICLGALSLPTFAQMPYAVRRDSVVAFFRGADIGFDAYSAIAKLRAPESREKGLAVAVSALNTAPRTILDRFRLTALLLHAGSFLPDSVRAKVQRMWEDFPPPPAESEHDRVCLATMHFLLAKNAGASWSWYTGRPSSIVRDEARQELVEWMDQVTLRGQEEFDSPTYAPLFITSLLLLRDFGGDPALKAKCEIVLNWILVDAALDAHGGQYAGAHAREAHQSAVEPKGSEMSALIWLYFGTGWQIYAREQFLCALSDFTPHPSVVEVARFRARPYTAIETKPVTARLRGRPGPARVAKTLFMHPLYAVGSIRGGLISPLEQHTWDVSFATSSTQSSLFTLQPYAGQEFMTDFWPGSPTFVHDYIGGLDPYFGAPNKTVGGSPYEDVMQHRNTIIAGYHVPEGTLFPHVTGILPHDTEAVEIDSLRTGWIMMNFGDVYVGIFPLANYTLKDNPEGRRLVFPAGWSGCIVTVAGRNDVGPFSDFKKKLLRTTGRIEKFASTGTVSYTTMDGDRLDYTFQGTHRVNGKSITPNPSILFSSPMVNAKVGSGIMTITTRNGNTVIDAKRNTIR